MEIMILSILGPTLLCEWNLELWEEAFITTVSESLTKTDIKIILKFTDDLLITFKREFLYFPTGP